jgi:DNA-binding beta-propeller fold protein YncE
VSNLFGRSLTVIDTATRALVETLPTPFYPAHLIVDGPGEHVYGTTQGGTPQLWTFDVASRTFSTIPLESEGKGLVLWGDFLFVALEDKNTVAVVSLLTKEVINSISTDTGPIDVAVSLFQDNFRLYVANATARTLTVYPAVPGASPIKTLQLSATPLALVTPRDRKEVLILYNNNTMQHVNGDSGNLQGIRPINGSPMYLSTSPDGAWIYASNTAGPVESLDRLEAFISAPLVLSPAGTRWITVQP